MERLLEFACTHDPITVQDLQAEFGVDVTSWLAQDQNHQRVLDNLKAFARRPQVDKNKRLGDFKNDRVYSDHFSDPAFRFQIHRPAKTDDIKIWLVGFYTQLKANGFHPLVCHYHDHFRDADWWSSFGAANKSQTMCVACDGTMNQGRSIKHYFPKALYPVLSIHPVNLIPVCNKCNHDKGDIDPLDGCSFDQLLIPYRDHIDQDIELDFVSVAGGKEQIQLSPLTAEPTLPMKLNKYSELFAIPAQWNNNIHEITQIGTTTLRHQLNGMRRNGAIVTKDQFADLIDAVCIDMELDWGNCHYYYPASKWLRWAKNNKFESLCTELGISSKGVY